MPKRKTVDNSVAEPAAAAADVKKRSTSAASTPKNPAATHKRASKKSVAPEVSPAVVPSQAPVAAAQVASHEVIARLAYSYWEARGCQGGCPQEDWLRAERELLELTQNR